MLIVRTNKTHTIHRRLRSAMRERDSWSRVLGYRGNVCPPIRVDSTARIQYKGSSVLLCAVNHAVSC